MGRKGGKAEFGRLHEILLVKWKLLISLKTMAYKTPSINAKGKRKGTGVKTGKIRMRNVKCVCVLEIEKN